MYVVPIAFDSPAAKFGVVAAIVVVIDAAVSVLGLTTVL